MQLGGGTALSPRLAHLEHMNLRAMGGIVAHAAHVHDLGQHERSPRQLLHGQHDRTEAADLVLRRHRAALPWRGRPVAAVVDQHQPLAFAILKRQRQPAVDLDDIAGDAAGLFQAIPPVAKAGFAGDAQAGPRNRVGSALLGRRRKIEEGEIGAGVGFAVGVEQVIGGDVILVDRLLDQPHAEQAGVEGQIVPRLRGDRGQVMNSA